MVIAKFSRDSIDMSNAHCGDCLAGATESLYECARRYGVAPLLTRGLCPLAETHTPPNQRSQCWFSPTYNHVSLYERRRPGLMRRADEGDAANATHTVSATKYRGSRRQ